MYIYSLLLESLSHIPISPLKVVPKTSKHLLQNEIMYTEILKE